MSPVIILPEYATPFDPNSISGLSLWLDGQDISTLWQDQGGTVPVTADAQSVLRWDDKSPNGWDFSAASAPATYNTVAGLNANPSVRFSGSQGLGSNALNLIDTTTVFVVVEFFATPGVGVGYSVWRLNDAAGPTYQEYFPINSGGYQPHTFKGDYGGAAPAVGVADALDTSPHRITYTFNNGDPTLPGSYTFSIDGVSKSIVGSANVGAVAGDTASVGGRMSSTGPNFSALGMNGWIGEVLAYSNVLSAPDIASVEAYLSSKWSI